MMKQTSPTQQAGIALFLALIALVIMSLAAVALVRTVDTGSLVIGNLAFKHNATNVADRGTESAIAWLDSALAGTACASNTPTTYCNQTASGYYASYLTKLDATGANTSDHTRVLIDWDADNCAYATASTFASCIAAGSAGTIDGNNIKYIITRLCKLTGDPNSASCRNVTTSDSGSPKKGEIKYGEDKRFTGSNTPYFRIIVRVKGARNTVSIVETTVRY
ncbi:pilus assembly PilX family protein [Chitinibacteraceae bacterium HSL-7]